MNIVLFDDMSWERLKPLTFTRPASELRVGILTIREKWEHDLNGKAFWATKEYLSAKYPEKWTDNNLVINGSILPNKNLVERIKSLKNGEMLLGSEGIIAYCSDEFGMKKLERKSTYDGEFRKLNKASDIFAFNGAEIEEDFERVTEGKESKPLGEHVVILGSDKNPDAKVFVEEGASVEYAALNVSEGSIYIGKDATIMEGSFIRGPFAMCEHAQVNMSTKIYPGTTLGPWCKAGGELNNVVMQAYSNKGHDGFLGNAVIGEWCNLGADTNNSNLKNNYKNVTLWSYETDRFEDTGLQFCGLILGDHSKTGINTMFNTGTVVGVACNVFGPGFPRTFIPSFQMGGPQGYREIGLKNFYLTADLVMSRRGQKMNPEDMIIWDHLFEETKRYR